MRYFISFIVFALSVLVIGSCLPAQQQMILVQIFNAVKIFGALFSFMLCFNAIRSVKHDSVICGLAAGGWLGISTGAILDSYRMFNHAHVDFILSMLYHISVYSLVLCTYLYFKKRG